MTEEQLNKIIEYIKINEPQETEFKTIDKAIRAVTGDFTAASEEDLVSRDDSWLVPDERREKIAGIKGKGWSQTLPPDVIKKLKDAVQRSKETSSIIKKIENISQDSIKDTLQQNINKIDALKELKEMYKEDNTNKRKK